MRGFILLIMLGVFFTNCKNNKDPEPLPEIADIAGGWKLTEQKYVSGDSTITVDINKAEQKDLFIRYDGVMLYDGSVSCCAVNKYVINGISFNVVPKEDTPPANFICDCMPCDELVITQTGDTMTVVYCNAGTSTYKRVK